MKTACIFMQIICKSHHPQISWRNSHSLILPPPGAGWGGSASLSSWEAGGPGKVSSSVHTSDGKPKPEGGTDLPRSPACPGRAGWVAPGQGFLLPSGEGTQALICRAKPARSRILSRREVPLLRNSNICSSIYSRETQFTAQSPKPKPALKIKHPPASGRAGVSWRTRRRGTHSPQSAPRHSGAHSATGTAAICTPPLRPPIGATVQCGHSRPPPVAGRSGGASSIPMINEVLCPHSSRERRSLWRRRWGFPGDGESDL